MSLIPQDWIVIEPITKFVSIHFIQVQVEQVVLNKGAYCFVVLYDQNKVATERLRMFIEGEDYNRWIQDDDIITVVMEKLNVQRKIIVIEEEEKKIEVDEIEEEKKIEVDEIEEDGEIEEEEENEDQIFEDE